MSGCCKARVRSFLGVGETLDGDLSSRLGWDVCTLFLIEPESLFGFERRAWLLVVSSAKRSQHAFTINPFPASRTSYEVCVAKYTVCSLYAAIGC